MMPLVQSIIFISLFTGLQCAFDGPSVVILSPNYTTIDLKEGQNLGPITCSAVCNPTCTILWRFNATVGDGRFVDQTTQNGVLHIVNVRCSMAGVYRCKAQNKNSFKRRDVYLNVLCKQQVIPTFNSQFGAAINSSLQISIPVIANPKPSLSWTNTSGIKIAVSDASLTGPSYEYLITIKLTIMNRYQYGNYTVTISNGLGSIYHTIDIFQRGKPFPVQSFINSDVDSTSVNFTWIPGFNGGATQHFVISHDSSKTSEWIVVLNVSDSGQTQLISRLIQGLMPNRRYRFRIVSANRFGDTSKTPLYVEFTTKGKPYPVKKFITSDVDFNSVHLTWVPGFNGGATQYFVISHDSPKTSKWIVVLNVSDSGQTRLMSRLVQGLMPNRRYRFRIVSANRFGDTSKTPLFVEFTTKGLPENDSAVSWTIVGVAAGVSALLVLITIGVVVCLAVNKLRKTGDERDYDEINTDNPSSSRTPSQRQTASSSAQHKSSSNPQDGRVYVNCTFKNPNQQDPDKLVIQDMNPGTKDNHIYSNQCSPRAVKIMNFSQNYHGKTTEHKKESDTGGVDHYTQLEFNDSQANYTQLDFKRKEHTST